jgi:hypothetical protein
MTSGANRMYLDPQGNLGIGTGAPPAPLHVVGFNNIAQNNLTETYFNFNSTTTLAHNTGVSGKECLDLKGVDYDAIAMLKVSATQELAKKVEALEAENAKLKGDADRLTTIEGEEKAKMVALETEVASLKAMSTEMAALKRAIASLQIKDKNAIRPVALNQ